LKRINCLWLFWGILISAAVNSHPSNASGNTLLARDARHFLNVGWGLTQAPLHFNPTDWGRTCLLAGSTGLLFAVDKNVKRFTLSHRSSFYDELFNLDQYYGNRYTLDSAIGLYGLGYLLKNNRVRLMGLYSIEAIFYSENLTAWLKMFLGRRRPCAGEDNLVFKPFKHQALYSSLPSGHATVGFAASTVLAKSLNCSYWKIFWYGVGVLVSASRIYHNVHWVSDLFFGGVIGYSTASWVMNFDKKGSASRSRHLFGEIYPYLSVNGWGVRVRLK